MRDHHQALEEVLRRTSDTPHWIQLPSNPSEDPMVQFCEGLPGLRIKPTVLIEKISSRSKTELVEFYRDYLAVTKGKMPLDETRFAMSRHAAPGLYLFVEALQGWNPWLVRGQITGPVTVLLGMKDEEGHSAYCDEQTSDVIVKLLALKACWQAEQLRHLGQRALVFVEENVPWRSESKLNPDVFYKVALASLSEVLRSIQATGCWSGMCVGGEADWELILQLTGHFNVLGFDSFLHFDKLVSFQKRIIEFLKEGGMLAWGIVPTGSEDLEQIKASDLAELWISQARGLADNEMKLIDIFARSFITPSTGLGDVAEELAVRSMDLTVMVSNILGGLLENPGRFELKT